MKKATPLLLCLICIELTDFVFAVDSIPAVLGISQDTFIIYASNVSQSPLNTKIRINTKIHINPEIHINTNINPEIYINTKINTKIHTKINPEIYINTKINTNINTNTNININANINTSMYVCMVITCSKSMDQPGKVANPARGQLNRENVLILMLIVRLILRLRLISRLRLIPRLRSILKLRLTLVPVVWATKAGSLVVPSRTAVM